MSNQSKVVLVTGATGFVALNCVGTLLEKGYSVIGSARSQAKADKVLGQFSEKFGKNVALKYVIVEDVGREGAFDRAFQEHQEIDYVFHTASPFSFGIDDGDLRKTYLEPALEGTLNVLKSVNEYAPQVKKVVVTSSFASVLNVSKIEDKSFIHTEETWNPIEWDDVQEENAAYFASKKLAERAAWTFIRENDVKFSLVTLTPPYIFGPQYFDSDASAEKLNTSSQMIKSLMHSDPNDTHLFKNAALLAVDVRDVAAFHELAIAHDEIQNVRLFPASGSFSDQLILNIINENFKELQGKIAKGDPEGESSIPKPAFKNDKSVQLVGGYEFIPLEKQVVDTVSQILKVQKN